MNSNLVTFEFQGQEVCARLVSPASRDYVIITEQVPAPSLTAAQLVERVKTYGLDMNASYGLYVRDRHLSPDIDMHEFTRLWNQVHPDPHVFEKQVPFRVTHYELLPAKGDSPAVLVPACVTSKSVNGVLYYVLDFGNGHTASGSSYLEHFQANFVPFEVIQAALEADAQLAEDEAGYNQVVESGLHLR